MKALLEISSLPAPVFLGVMVSWLPISVALIVGAATALAVFAMLWLVFQNDEEQLNRY